MTSFYFSPYVCIAVQIDFERKIYEVPENAITILVYLIKENNQTTEQTYSVDLTVGDPGGNFKPATIETSNNINNKSFDYSFGLPGQTKINRFFPPTVDRIAVVISLNPDSAVEGTEYFRVTARVTAPGGVTAFASTLICILDDDSKYQLLYV